MLGVKKMGLGCKGHGFDPGGSISVSLRDPIRRYRRIIFIELDMYTVGNYISVL